MLVLNLFSGPWLLVRIRVRVEASSVEIDAKDRDQQHTNLMLNELEHVLE